MSNKVNPDSVILEQLDGQWQKFAMFILMKTVGRDKPVRITAADMEQVLAEFEPGIPVVFTHGGSDFVEFSVVDEAAAARIAEHDRRMRGAA